MRNTLGDLNNHLFAQLERLGDEEITGEKLQTKARPFKRKNPKAGDICDPTASFYGEGRKEKNKGITQLAPFIFENMNFTERAEITAVMRRAMIRIAEEYVNGAKENAEWEQK